MILSAASFAESWADHARKLSGESDAVHEHAIRVLKKIPNLETLLRTSLKSHTHEVPLAFDVIGTLKLKPLWKDLIDFSKEDESGMSYLALVTLTDETNHLEVKSLFQERLNLPSTSAVSKMILLDALMRMKQSLSVALVERLLSKKSEPEVRSAALYYIRGMFLHEKDTKYLPLVDAFSKETLSSQLRTQLDYFTEERSKVQ